MQPLTSQEWYLAQCQRGQALLDRAQVDEAQVLFTEVLTRLGDAPCFERAVIIGRLARCSYLCGKLEATITQLQQALVIVEALGATKGTRALHGSLRSELGDAFYAAGQYAAAHKAYASSLQIAEQLGNLRGQGVDLGHLGALALSQGELEEARTHYQQALPLFQQIQEAAIEAHVWYQLGKVFLELQQPIEAERHYREAARLCEATGNGERVVQIRNELTALHAQVWARFGELGDIADAEAAVTADSERKCMLQARARELHELSQHVPRLLDTLNRLGTSPSCGRAVMLGRLGRCFHLAGAHDLGLTRLREAIETTAKLSSSDIVSGLRGALYTELGDMLAALGDADEAKQMHDVAREIAQALDKREPDADRAQAGLEITIKEELSIGYAFDTNLLIDGQRELRVGRWSKSLAPVAEDARPVLMSGTRSWTEDDGIVHFALSLEEPVFERHSGCTVMRRTKREVMLAGHSAVLARIISAVDGECTVAQILSLLATDQRAIGSHIFSALLATGVIDISGRATGRLLHAATKKGVMPGGGLEGDDIVRLTTDGNYREYPGVRQIALSPSIPERLQPFHALTRSRRSKRVYLGTALTREEFDSMLSTACGVTGTLSWEGRTSHLRAYPSSGGLYAVEIYPIVFRVDGLEPAVYHYRPAENMLEQVRPIERAAIVQAMLPIERQMVEGVSALICMTGNFHRHEHKYGQGGYRMLVAEVGHISQNLVLAANALGLAARPCGGVFDQLMNEELGLDEEKEQFMLSVLVGHAGSK